MSNEYPNSTNPAPIHGKVDHYDCDLETGTISYHVVTTNGDQIRSMTDEELSKFANGCPPNSKRHLSECLRTDCCGCWLEWLKKEVSE